MRQIPSRITLFARPESPEATRLVERMAAWFAERGVKSRTLDTHASAEMVRQVAAGCDIALVVGGDGSMIAVGRRLSGLNLPILGINMGTLGFLTVIPASEWEANCTLLLEKGFIVRERLALAYAIHRDGRQIPLPEGNLPGAVNDIIFSRTMLARVINLNVEINGKPFTRLRGDGLLVSSPVGSTGYAMSAGGALLYPDINAMELTPVCSVLNSSRPVVVPGDAVIRVSQAKPWTEVGVTVDGQDCFLLEPGDCVEVRAARQGTRFAFISECPYTTQLAAKGYVSPPEPERSDND